VKSISLRSKPPLNFQKNNHNLVESEQKLIRIFVDSKQLSEIICIPVYTIRQKVREGVFPAYQMTKKSYLFKVSEIVKIIEESKIDLNSDSKRHQNAMQRRNDLSEVKGGQ